ncbi:tyrosine phosphatase family protein [Brevundimonas terrae]|uniref:Tyrosine phosphatase family protein n=1 Tax=Brevundimonas terrae TaxID=363631 RepID=A0ABN0YKJ2_9CAUL|nr:tyrosine protein phosphatase [Brevundimonas terrae]NIJ27441.1 putative protein tyrosine phosphatase [Brevundimonas terrae]
MSRIIVCPLHDVSGLVQINRPSHVVSLMSPTADLDIGLADGQGEHLDLRFNDINQPQDGLLAPSENHIRAYLDFLDRWDGSAPLLIHCWAGVSRSPAAAYIAAVVRHGIGSEHDIALTLRAKAPYATPNRRMIEIADNLLQRQSAMIVAVDAIGRGSDTAWGSSFSLSGR